MIITSIEPQKKHKDRVNIYLDGEYFCAMSLFASMKYGIKEGREIDEEKMSYIRSRGDVEVAIDKAMKHLSKSQKTEKEMTDFLLTKGFEQDTIDEVLSKLKEYSYIDDVKFATDYVRSYATREGEKKIYFSLRQKGIDEDIINDVLTNYEFDSSVPVGLLSKYMQGKPRDIKNKQRAYRFLLSRGFDSDLVRSTIDQVFEEE